MHWSPDFWPYAFSCRNKIRNQDKTLRCDNTFWGEYRFILKSYLQETQMSPTLSTDRLIELATSLISTDVKSAYFYWFLKNFSWQTEGKTDEHGFQDSPLVYQWGINIIVIKQYHFLDDHLCMTRVQFQIVYYTFHSISNIRYLHTNIF